MTDNSVHGIGSNLQISFPYVYGENIERMYPNVRISIERITPEVAEQMLTANIGNRDIKKSSIVYKVLQDNEWEMNGATIVFDEHGVLRDGQHRLSACVKSGKSIESVIVRGVKPESQITMDTGSRRALRDYTKMRGYKNYSHVATVGLALYIVNRYGLRSYFMDSHGGKATYKATISYIDTHYDTFISEIVDDVLAIQRAYPGKSIPAGPVAAVLNMFKGADEEDYAEFIAQLTNRRPACVSVRSLQDKLRKYVKKSEPKRKTTNKELAAFFVKTWNAYMRGDDIKQLKFAQGGAHPESFPDVFLGYE